MLTVPSKNHRAGRGENRKILCLAAVGIAVMLVLILTSRDTPSVDFNQFYSAGKLVGTGHLYDWPAIRSLELEHNSNTTPFVRLPIYALIFRGLSVLPYPLARLLYLWIELAALAGALVLWPFSRFENRWARVWLALCWFAPLTIGLVIGQDPVLVLFFMSLGCRLLVSGKSDFWAGVAFSICASKFHLVALLPVALVAQSRWKALLGGAAGGAVILGTSFALEGPDWPGRFLALTRLQVFDPALQRMPNLRELLSFTGAGFPVEVALSLLAVAVIFLLCRRLPLPYAMSLALAGGLLISHHAYLYDCVLLLPAILLVLDEPFPAWLRTWARLLLTPMPYILLMTDIQLPGNLAITGFTIALLATLVHRLRQPSAVPTLAALAART